MRGSRVLIGFLLLSGASVLLGNLIIAVLSLPTNPDTVSYRLPRIYWYLSSGALEHFAPNVDKRLVFYPLNGVLLQMPIVQYRWPGQLFHLTTLAAWVLTGLTCYRLSREMGLGRAASAVTAWLVCLTPGVLVQALSTNDEILAAFILLIGLHFLLRFIRSRALPDIALAMLAAGLSSGTKLHVVFFLPWLLAALFWLLFAPATRAWGSGVLTKMGVKGLALIVLFGATSALLAAAFLWPNWKASGHLMDPAFTRSVMNQPFDRFVGLQNLVLHTVQMVLGPIPDLYTSGLMSKRERVYSEFNALFRPLFSWVQQEAPYTAGYRFVGPSQTNAYFLTEPGIGIGFSYIIMFVGLTVSIVRHDRIGILAGSAFFSWFVVHTLSSKYIEGFSVYLAYAFIVCSPAIACFMVKGNSSGRRRLLVLLAVVAAHAVFAATLLRFGGVRNLNYVREAASWPLRLAKVDSGITAAFRSSGSTRFVENHPAIPYWSLMDTYKAGRYSVTSSRALIPEVLTIIACQQNTAWHCAPLSLPRKPSPGLTLLGEFNSAFGAEWAFGSGAGIERRPGYRSGFLVFQFDTGTDAEEWIAIRDVWGIDPSEKLEFRYILVGEEGPVSTSEWRRDPGRRLSIPGKVAGATLQIEVRFAGESVTLATLRYPLGSPQLFRIDG